MQSDTNITRSANAGNVAGRVPELDGIRGLAMVLVLIWHYFAVQVQTQPGTLAAYGMKLFSLTWAGVDLFFVLSGFLIGGILLDQRAAPHYFRGFYVRRFCRIFPLYYLMRGLFIVGTASGFSIRDDAYVWLFADPLPLWSYATYLQNFSMAGTGAHGPNWLGITWSLAIEEQFYVVLPLMIRVFPLRALPWVLLLLVAAAPAFRGLMLAQLPHGGLADYVLLPGRWDALFLGVLGALAIRHASPRAWLAAHPGMIRWVVGTCAVIIVGLLAKSQGIGSAGMAWFGHTILALMALGLVFLAIIPADGWVRRFFRNSSLVWVGTVSYGIYLFHQPVAGLMHAWLRGQAPKIASGTDAMVTLLSLAITLGVSAISWRLFERPIVQAGQRVSYQG